MNGIDTTSSSTRCRRWMTGLRLVITVTLVGLILWRLGGVEDVGSRLLMLSPWSALLVALVISVDRVLMTYKWSLLLRSQGIHLPLWSGMRVYCASLVWGMFLPATVGADAVRAYSTARRGVDADHVVASIVVERMVGFLAALVLGCVGFQILWNAGLLDPRFQGAWWIAGILLPVGTLLFLASFHQPSFEFLLRRIPSRLREGRLVRRICEFQEKYSRYRRQKATLVAFGGLTMIEQLFPILYAWLIAWGIGVDVSLLVVAGALPLALLISRVPVAIQGIGVFDAIFMILLTSAGVAPADAIAITFLVRVLEALTWLPWWMAHVLEWGRLSPPPVSHPSS